MDAHFVGSFEKIKDLPVSQLLEIAVAGRSNCGKSSLINALTKKQKLARTSKTPGRTQQLVFFFVTLDKLPSFHLVDLPGYGFAKVSKKQKEAWGDFVSKYVETRPQLRILLLLNDLRRPPEQEEKNLLHWAKERNLISIVVLTKSDKISKNRRFAEIESARTMLKLKHNPLAFSIHDSDSVDKLREKIEEALKTLTLTQ